MGYLLFEECIHITFHGDIGADIAFDSAMTINQLLQGKMDDDCLKLPRVMFSKK